MSESPLTESEDEALDALFERGGDEGWVRADEIGDRGTVEELAVKGAIHLEENSEGERWVSMGGFRPGDPPEPDDPDEEAAEAAGAILDSGGGEVEDG